MPLAAMTSVEVQVQHAQVFRQHSAAPGRNLTQAARDMLLPAHTGPTQQPFLGGDGIIALAGLLQITAHLAHALYAIIRLRR